MSASTGRPGDPDSVVGLIYRIVDVSRRTLCAVAILALPCGALAHFAGAPPVFGIPASGIGVGVSGLSILAAWVAHRLRGNRSDGDNEQIPPPP